MTTAAAPSQIVGRYAIFDEIASGGMATVHFGRLLGSVGFSRTVAIKRLHAHLAKDPEFVKMFLDEARVAARIRHPNVVPTLDVVSTDGQLFLVMEYVQGESLARLLRAVRQRNERIPVPIACAIMVGALQGLHAAHEASNEKGDKLGIVHRDVSPQNVMVGRDGVAHVLDFGVAKATGRLQTTRDGQLKGKLGYMPPEQIRGGEVTRTTDIYAASVVLWELLVGDRLFAGENEANVLERVLFGEVMPPSSKGAGVPTALDAIVMRGLSRDSADRFSTAREMARALEAAVPIASTSDVSEWVEKLAGATLDERQRKVTEIESRSDVHTGSHFREMLASMSGEVAAPRSSKASKAAKSAKTADVAGSTPGPKSDLSSVSVSMEEPHLSWAPPSRRRGVLVFAGAVALGGLVSIVVVARHSPDAPIPSAPTVAAQPPPTPDIPPPPPATPSAEAIPAGATAGATTTLSATAATPPPAAPVVAAAPALPRPAATPRGGTKEITRDFPGAVPNAKPKTGCNPPYYIDAQGVKQYKVDCL